LHNQIEAEQAVESFGDEVPADLIEQVEKSLIDANVGNFGLVLSLIAEVKSRIAPFFFENNLMGPRFSARHRVGYPVTDMETIMPYCAFPKRITTIEAQRGPVPALWVEAITGNIRTELHSWYEMLELRSTSSRLPSLTCSEHSYNS
jgi:hypothetical protein